MVAVSRPKSARKSFVVKTTVEVADFFGVTKQAVSQWIRANDPMPRQRGGYDLSKIAQWRSRQQAGNSLADELKLADIRLKTVQAQQKELDMEIQKGELIPSVDVERWASMALIETREMVMTLPELIATSTPPDIREFARSETDRHCRDVLTLLQRRLEEDVNDTTDSDAEA